MIFTQTNITSIAIKCKFLEIIREIKVDRFLKYINLFYNIILTKCGKSIVCDEKLFTFKFQYVNIYPLAITSLTEDRLQFAKKETYRCSKVGLIFNSLIFIHLFQNLQIVVMENAFENRFESKSSSF